MQYDEKTKKLLNNIQQTITELDEHLSQDQLDAEAFLMDYEDTLNNAMDHMLMALQLTPDKQLFNTFSTRQQTELIHTLISFNGGLKAVRDALDCKEDMFVYNSF